jgi:hypothetical protein
VKAVACFCGGLLLAASPLDGGERLILKVTPSVCFAPANVLVRTIIEAHPANRVLKISAESADFYRASSIQLDGDKAPRANQFEFRHLSAGTYSVRVEIAGSDGESLAFALQQVEVIPVAGKR